MPVEGETRPSQFIRGEVDRRAIWMEEMHSRASAG